MLYLTFLIIGLLMGYFYRNLRDSIKELQKKQPKPDIGVTPASYGPTFHKENQSGNVGLVTPKTPQQMEWEEQERLKEMQHNVKVGP